MILHLEGSSNWSIMYSKPLESSMDSKLLQPLNKCLAPIDITLGGITIFLKEEQSVKAKPPIDSTLDGISIDVSL